MRNTLDGVNSSPGGGDLKAIRRGAAAVYLFACTAVIAFQIALALGAPWGAYAMGGSFPGQLPPTARITALGQAALLAFTALVVVSRAALALPRWSRASHWLVWAVVAILSLSLVGNLLTPSAGERMLWVPVLVLMLVTSILVATERPGRD
jgi:hypothetical protein